LPQNARIPPHSSNLFREVLNTEISKGLAKTEIPDPNAQGLQTKNELSKRTNKPTNTELPKFELEAEASVSLSMLSEAGLMLTTTRN
jgi:hypothetical protein